MGVLLLSGRDSTSVGTCQHILTRVVVRIGSRYIAAWLGGDVRGALVGPADDIALHLVVFHIFHLAVGFLYLAQVRRQQLLVWLELLLFLL